MSEQPKIEIANLPSGRPPTAPNNPPKPPPPPPPPAPPLKPAPADPPPKRSSAVTIGLAVVCLLLIAITAFHVHRVHSLESNLDQTKTETTQLQNQLAQARNDAKTVQENADKLTQQAASLKSQLSEAQNMYTEAKANADKMTGQMATLQSQLNEARRAAAKSKAAADKAASDLARLQASTQAQPESAPAPAPAAAASVATPAALQLPLSVAFKKPEVGDGMALVLQNTSSSTLPVRVTFTNPTSGKSKEYQISMDGGATKELGSLGAWKLASGDRVAVESGDYAPILRTAP